MRLKFIFLSLLLIIISSQYLIGATNCNVLYPIPKTTIDGVKWGYISCKGKVVVEPQFISASDFHDNVGIVVIEQKPENSELKSGIVNLDGTVITLPNTIISSDFSEGLAFSKTKGKWAFINKLGKVVILIPDSIKLQEESPLAFEFKKGVAGINSEDGIYLINRKGELTYRKDILASFGFINELEVVLVKDGFTIIDSAARPRIPPQKNPIMFSGDGLFLIETENGKWKYIDNKGREVLEVSFNYAGLFSQGLAVIKINDKWGYMNRKGKVVIPAKFEDANTFSEEGLAAVKLKNKYGFINKTGKFIIPPKFDYIYKHFRYGLAYVQENNIRGYINKTGKWVWKIN
jgi:hypothetical protein